MWPDKPLAQESALVGRTQLARRSPPHAWLGFPAQTENPVAACTPLSPPGAQAASYPSASQSSTRLFQQHMRHTNACGPSRVLSVCPPGENMYMKKWLRLRAWDGWRGLGVGGGSGSQNNPQIWRMAFRLTGSRLMAIRGILAKRLLGQ